MARMIAEMAGVAVGTEERPGLGGPGPGCLYLDAGAGAFSLVGGTIPFRRM
jgi:hypothetical protein